MSSIIIFVINDSLAQLVEHLTLNQQVPGSSPGQPIIISIWKSCVYKSEIFNSFIQKKIEKYR